MSNPVSPADAGRHQDQPKVFGIGFHKTGTKSLAAALRHLGYTVTGPNGILDPDIATKAWPLAKDLIEDFGAFQDNPWPILFEQLYSYRPDSKFVLTTRDPDEWIQSVLNHFGTRTTPMREWIYGAGAPAGNERLYMERFNRHYSDVVSFFCDKPESLLIIDITAAEGWEKLCPFLGKPIPSGPFPFENRRQTEKRSRIRSMMRRKFW